MNSTTEGQPGTSQEQTGSNQARSTRQPLRRPSHGRLLAGVAAAIASHLNIDVSIVRIAFTVITIVGFTGIPFFGGVPFYLAGIPLYLACWLLIPEEGSEHSILAGWIHAQRERSSQDDSR